MQILVYAGFTLLGITLAVLLLIGVLDVVRGTPVRRVLADEKGGDSVAVGQPFFREAMELLTRTRLRPAHDVEIFMNGDETYSRLFADLRAAKSSITMQLYYCNKGRMADTLREILVDRAKAGVEIYFLYDSFGTSLKEDFFDPLKAAGVRLGRFRPFSLLSMQKAQHRAHIRVVVIDGTIGYTGGFGLDDKWYGDGRSTDQWRDTNVGSSGRRCASFRQPSPSVGRKPPAICSPGHSSSPTGRRGCGARASSRRPSPRFSDHREHFSGAVVRLADHRREEAAVYQQFVLRARCFVPESAVRRRKARR